MIEVRYDREEMRVNIFGHAYSAEFGRDLICAGASTLAITLAANAQHMEDIGWVSRADIDIGSGHTDVVCEADEEKAQIVRAVFDSICVGFEIMAAKYPEHIQYVVTG